MTAAAPWWGVILAGLLGVGIFVAQLAAVLWLVRLLFGESR